MNADIYTDVGAGGNESIDSLLKYMFENSYDISTWNFSTYTVNTDTSANTWCRAPGKYSSLVISRCVHVR